MRGSRHIGYMSGPSGRRRGSPMCSKPRRRYRTALRSLLASRYAARPSRSQRSRTEPISAVPSPSPSTGGDADHPQVFVGAALGVDARGETADHLHPLVVRVDGPAQLGELVLALSRPAVAGVLRGHGHPQGARRTVLDEVDAPVGEGGVGEGGHEPVVRRTAVLRAGEHPAADRIVLERLVQQPDHQFPVVLMLTVRIATPMSVPSSQPSCHVRGLRLAGRAGLWGGPRTPWGSAGPAGPGPRSRTGQGPHGGSWSRGRGTAQAVPSGGAPGDELGEGQQPSRRLRVRHGTGHLLHRAGHPVRRLGLRPVTAAGPLHETGEAPDVPLPVRGGVRGGQLPRLRGAGGERGDDRQRLLAGGEVRAGTACRCGAGRPRCRSRRRSAGTPARPPGRRRPSPPPRRPRRPRTARRGRRRSRAGRRSSPPPWRGSPPG